MIQLSSGTCLRYNAIVGGEQKGRPSKIGSAITASLGRCTLQSLAKVNVWSYQWQLYLHLWTDLIQHHGSSTGAREALPSMPLFVLAGGMSSVFSTLRPIQSPFLSLRGAWHIAGQKSRRQIRWLKVTEVIKEAVREKWRNVFWSDRHSNECVDEVMTLIFFSI